ncbi:MAG: hypothetical protein BWY53_00177 [Parcubacteria group bacterium ADurb.Bin326]|nr:MAG: hypothetical protein BWY53_00177 [Parcubacteria group bacterium ADurb.Bin326]
MKQSCRWFIEPRDQRTNEAVAGELPGEEVQELFCDGETIRVLECPWKLVEFFSRVPSLDFNLYARNGNGPVRKANCVIRGKGISGTHRHTAHLSKGSDLKPPQT